MRSPLRVELSARPASSPLRPLNRAFLALIVSVVGCASQGDGTSPQRHPEATGQSQSRLSVVTNGAFTNVYVYPDPNLETWEQHIKSFRSDSAQFSRAALDAATDRLMTPGWPSYFDSLYQYSGINPPQFFGSSVASQECVSKALVDASGGVLQWDTIRSLANCHVAGMDPSPQVNLIFSPDMKVGRVPPDGISDSQPDMCAPGSTVKAWHAWGINVPNFAALPTGTGCQPGFADFTRLLSHEDAEMVSDPAAAGFGVGGTDEVADLCEHDDQPKTFTVAGDTFARYWSDADDDCQPRLDSPSGSTAVTWLLGQGSPVAQLSGTTSVTLNVPAGRTNTDAKATQVSIVLQTGDDDLRSDSSAQVTINTVNGGTTTQSINSGHHWNNGETNSAILTLPVGATRVSDIQGVTITSNFSNGDNWHVNKVGLVVSFAATSALTTAPPPPVHPWIDASGGALIRFSGDQHDLPLSVPPPPIPGAGPPLWPDVGHPIQSLALVISTGNDDLRGGSNAGDNCDVILGLASGQTLSLPNVNHGETWGGWTKHTIDIPLPAGFVGGDLTAVKLHTGFGGDTGGDNWNVERVQLLATVLPLPPPTVSFVLPNVGPPEGVTSVRIDGTSFEVNGSPNPTQILIGGVPATNVSCTTSTSCTALVPPGSGAQPITVVVDGVSVSAAVNYIYSPSITGLSENSGVIGDTVMISGIGLGNATAINFGPYPVPSFQCWNQPSECRVTVPGGTGTVDVRVTIGGETTPATAADSFTYEAPSISSVTPSGPVSGDTDVDILGAGFDTTLGDVQVYFGSQPSPRVSCSSSTWCTAQTPPATQPGPVDVRLISRGVPTPLTPLDVFTYSLFPAIDYFVYGGINDIRLNGIAPAGGAVVTVTCNDPLVMAPTTVTVPAGQLSTNDFALPVQGLTEAERVEHVTLTASYEGSSYVLTLSLGPEPAPACVCTGTGLHGPVAVRCGQTVIGTNNNSYLCNAPGGTNDWALCQCQGTGINGPVTVNCGQSTIGTDGKSYVCNAPGGTNGFGPCTCTSALVKGPVACGQSAVGTDGATYVCNAPGGTSGLGPCQCNGTGINGPVTVACGQTTCGTDSNTYLCNAPGSWTQKATGCGCIPRVCDGTMCGKNPDGCGGTISCAACAPTCTTPKSCCLANGGSWSGGGCS